jgi:hypothetical protein
MDQSGYRENPHGPMPPCRPLSKPTAHATQVGEKKSVILRKFKKFSSKMSEERGESRGATK